MRETVATTSFPYTQQMDFPIPHEGGGVDRAMAMKVGPHYLLGIASYMCAYLKRLLANILKIRNVYLIIFPLFP